MFFEELIFVRRHSQVIQGNANGKWKSTLSQAEGGCVSNPVGREIFGERAMENLVGLTWLP